MKYALFLGCKIPYYVPYYEKATRVMAARAGIELVDIEFNCCGYPMKHLDLVSALASAARNLALAEQEGLNLMTPCKCCFGSFKAAIHHLESSPELRSAVAAELAKEGLYYKGEAQVDHLSTALDKLYPGGKLQEAALKPFYNLEVAVLHGCHAMRPSSVTGFDDPLNPTLYKRLLGGIGVKVTDWPGQLECCGGPLMDKNPELSARFADQRLAEAETSGAAFMMVGCTYTQMQMTAALERQPEANLGGSIVLPQLFGLAIGCAPLELGLSDEPGDNNGVDLKRLLKFMEKPPEPVKKKKPKAKAKKKAAA